MGENGENLILVHSKHQIELWWSEICDYSDMINVFE